MKFVCRLFVLLCLCYKIVNGKTSKANKPKEIISLNIEPVKYETDDNYLKHGSSKKITCRGSQKYQKIEWYDPNGEQMERNSDNRVFVQDAIAPSLKSKAQSLVQDAIAPSLKSKAQSLVQDAIAPSLKSKAQSLVQDAIAPSLKSKAQSLVQDAIAPSLKSKAQSLVQDAIAPSLKSKAQSLVQDAIAPSLKSKAQSLVQDAIAPSLKSKAQSLVLVFKEALVEDSGVWECRSGELLQKVPLCVLEPVVFVDTPTEVTIDEGRAITITCQAKGNPEPKIVWYRHGEVVTEIGDKIYISTKYNQHGFEGLLTIKSLTTDDSGAYVCEAVQEIPDMDDCSHAEATNITLNVNQRPKFSNGPNPGEPIYVFAQDDEVVELTCDPKAYPTPRYRWFKEVLDVWTEYPEKQFKVSEDGTQNIFTVTANSSTFDQKFRCIATNEYGSAIAVFELKKLVKPLRVTEFYVSNATDTVIMFNVTGIQDCEPCSIEGFNIQYFEKRTSGSPREVHWKRAHTGNWITEGSSLFGGLVITLAGLKSDTEYWVRVRPYNSLGHAPWSLPLLVTTRSEDYEDYEVSTDEELQKPLEATDYGMFYGFLLTGIIVVFGAICIFFVKRV